MAFSNGPIIVRDGLVLALDASDRNSYPGSGTTWTDISGNRNNGTLINGPTFSNTNSGIIIFDGTDDYVSCGNPSSLQITGNLTLQTWIKESSGGSIVGNYCSKNDNQGYRIRRDGANGSGLWLYSYGNSVVGGNIFDGIWYMVTGVFSSTGLRAYINTSLVASNSNAYSPLNVSSGDFLIGTAFGIGEAYGGDMASMMVYNIALTDTQIIQNYNATKSRFNLI